MNPQPAMSVVVPERIAKRRKWERGNIWGARTRAAMFIVFACYLYFIENVPLKDLEWLGYFYMFIEVIWWMRTVVDLLLLIAYGEDDGPSSSEIREAKRAAKKARYMARYQQHIAEQQNNWRTSRLRSFLTRRRANEIAN